MIDYQDQERTAHWQRIKSRLSFASLALIALVLFVGVVGAAVWRAYGGEQYPPTPTIPAGVKPNFAYVSNVSGYAESYTPGLDIAIPLAPGSTVAAGQGSLVRADANSTVRLGLAVGTTFFLDENTEIELRQLADEEGQTTETVIQLNYGRLLIDASLEDEFDLTVLAPTGARALTTEAVMGLDYERDLQRFSVHCLAGACTLQSQGGREAELGTGELGWVQGLSAPFAVRAAAYELFQDIGDPGLVPTATATQEDTTTTPTATAERPSPTPITLEPSPQLPTFTPRPNPTNPILATSTSTVTPTDDNATGTPQPITPTASPTMVVTATVAPSATVTGTRSGTATATPTVALTGTSTITSTSSAPTSTVPTATVVNSTWLNIRQGPGVDYDYVTAVQDGTTLELTGFRDADATWVSVRVPEDGAEGWAHTYYLKSDYPFENLELWEGGTPAPTGTATSP